MFARPMNTHRKGFTLIELAIVLGIVGVMSAGLYKLMGTSNQQTKDTATAQQQLALINAVKGYLADNSDPTNSGQAWMKGFTGIKNLQLPSLNTSVANCTTSLGTNNPGLCKFLPPGFTAGTRNGYGQKYTIQVMRDNNAGYPLTYSFMIVASSTATANTIVPDTDGARISAAIGADGGFVYSSNAICGKVSPNACGTMGAWTVDAVNAYGYTATAVGGGSVASMTTINSSTNAVYSWLARVLMPGDNTTTNNFYNTMTTPLFMGNNPALALPTPNSISLGTAGTPTSGAGAAELHMAGGKAFLDGGTLDAMTNGNGNINLGTLSKITGTQNPTGTSGGNQSGSTIELHGYMGDNVTHNNGNFAALNVIQHGCFMGSISDDTCRAVAAINGDMTVSGLLSATKVYAGNYIYSSDRNLKKDVHTLSDSLENILKIRPVSFTYKVSGQETMGVIAQEIEKIYPRIVERDPKGFKAVSYDALIAPMIGAIQELHAENANLRQQISRQQERQDRLEQEIQDLKK